MKNYVIVLLTVLVVVLTSFLYKGNKEKLYDNFPIERLEDPNVEIPFHIYIFFSKGDCPPCLEIINVLNQLPAQFKVTGIIPENELGDIKEIRQSTGATFKLIGRGRFARYIPNYTPTLLGMSESGQIFFVLPSVPGQNGFVEKFLNQFYNKIYPRLLQEK
jgi:hypothetical protein